jgi:large subunit ribosomal protein L22
MSKPNAPRSLADSEAQAITRNMRVSPRKLNLVAASIRNLPAGKAIADLTFSKRRIAKQVKKTLESAVANAENNHQLDVDKLVVKLAEVGRGIVMKRFHARGRGRSATVEKWFSHLKIVVAEREPVEKPQRDTKPGRSKSTTPVASSKAAVEPAGETA